MTDTGRAPIQGVQLALSGPSASSTVSGPSGAYQFGNLGAGAYVVTPSSPGATFAPQSVAIAVSGQPAGANFMRSALILPSTALISSYAATLHAQTMTTFGTNEQALGNSLTPNFSVELGAGSSKKAHRFDLGCEDPPILIECKSHNFRVSGGIPSAKVTVWNEAMYFFHLAPHRYRKILFVLEARHERQRETLASCYARNFGHLIPGGVEIVEYSMDTKALRVVPHRV